MSVQNNGGFDIVPNPMSDVFTAVLWSAPQNEPILRSFINAVLIDIGGTPIKYAKVQNPFRIRDFVVGKSIILDVRVEDEDKRVYNIEVQVANHPAFANRILQYWAKLYASQLKPGDGYALLRPVISIVLVGFPMFPKLKGLHNLFQLAAEEDPAVLMTDHLQIHFVQLSDLQKGHLEKLEGVCRELRHWVNFFAFAGEKTEDEMTSLIENDPILREAYEELQRFYANGESRNVIEQREQFLFDYQYGINSAKEAGWSKGKAEGKAEGLEEGEIKQEIKGILRTLSKRLGPPSEQLKRRLHALNDLVRLEKLADLALDCTSIEEFEASLK